MRTELLRLAEGQKPPVDAQIRRPRAHSERARVTKIGAPTTRQWLLLAAVNCVAVLIALIASYRRQLQKQAGPQDQTESWRAKVSDEPYNGPCATGQVLIFDAAVQPLYPARVKEIRIDASYRLIDLEP